MAVTTGAADALECLIRRIGIADSEFTTDGGAGRVHLYEGGGGTNSFMTGGAFAKATALWSSPQKLANYDIQIMSCEGSTSKYTDMKPQTSIDNVANYVNGGGRLFVSHLHFYWLQKRATDLATATGPFSVMDPLNDVTLTVNQGFPKGLALAQWLATPAVGASTTLGQLAVSGSEHSVNTVNMPTSEWLYYSSPRSSQYLSFNTPVAAPEANQCGKVVFTDIHIQKSISVGGVTTGGDDSDPDKPFPSGCKTNMMSPQAKALEFLFFDLTSCVEPPTKMPTAPIPQPPGMTTGPPGPTGKPPAVPPPPPPPPPPDPG